MDAVAVPVGARQRARERLAASVHAARTRRALGVGALTFAGAMTALALLIAPPAPNAARPLSFLEVAHAAYADMASKVDPAFPVRHTVVEIVTDGTWNGPVRDTRESWALAESGRSFTVVSSSLSDETDFSATVNGVGYAPSERAALVDGQVLRLEADSFLLFAEGDDTMFVDGNHSMFALSFNGDVNGIGFTQDPADASVLCVEVTEKSPEQREREAFVAALKGASGYGAEAATVDQEEVVRLLLEGKEKGFVEDLGMDADEDGSELQWFRAAVRVAGVEMAEVRTTVFGFDAATHSLRTVVSIDDDGLGNVVTNTARVTRDEFVALSAAHPGLMNPEGQGLVRVEPYPVQELPTFAIEEGCYRELSDRVERLGEEEEAAARARIANVGSP